MSEPQDTLEQQPQPQTQIELKIESNPGVAFGNVNKVNIYPLEKLSSEQRIPILKWLISFIDSKILKSRKGQVGALLFLVGGPVLVLLGSPLLAEFFRVRGLTFYQDETLSQIEQRSRALVNYRLGLIFNPWSRDIQFERGLLYEDWQKWDEAVQAYETAIEGEIPEAYNNLARLYILNKGEGSAVDLLYTALDSTKHQALRVEDIYNFHKNLGWALFEKGNYGDAQEHLEEALSIVESVDYSEIIRNRASVHCLMAQVLEKQDQDAQARQHWQRCLELRNTEVSEENEWRNLATQRLNAQPASPQADGQKD